MTVAEIVNSLLPNSDLNWRTTRPSRYNLNQIPNDYTVEVRNRFKGLDLIDRVPDELWMELHDTVQETRIKTISKIKKCKKQNGYLRRACRWLWKEEKQKAKEKRKKICPFEIRVPKYHQATAKCRVHRKAELRPSEGDDLIKVTLLIGRSDICNLRFASLTFFLRK